MWQYNHSPCLQHSGVKGMRWGVRKKTDTSKSEAQQKADRNLKIKKVAVVVAGVAVIAAGSYFAHKYYTMNADTLIKKGKPFQHMGKLGEDLSKPFYASHLKSDNKVYSKADFFGANWTTQKTLIGNKDIKIAGKKRTLNTFSEWVQTSPIAKETFGIIGTPSNKEIKTMYERFNRNLTSPDMRDKKVFNDFYSALARKGYDAIRDVNDQQYSGTKSPLIVFNSLSDILVTKVKDLS